ncbi:MAG TPA: GNAT family N-acetyltransferase [Acidimicrobiales bacterium]
MKVSERFKVGITRYRPTDAEDLAAFQRTAFGEDAKQLDKDRFAWMFERNPARTDEGPGVWVCRRNGVVVGQQAEIPVDLVVDGQSQPAAWGIDLMVDPEWRLKGVGPGLMATQLEAHDVVIGLTQAEEAFKSYMRGGWTDVGVVPVYVRPVDVKRFLRVAPVPGQARRLAPVAGPLLRGFDWVASRWLRARGLRLVPVDRFDARVDEVWAAASGDYGVIAVRDAASTTWRLDDRPDADELRRYYLMQGGQAVGYLALRHRERWGDQAAYIVDFLAPKRRIGALLLLAGRAARRDGAFALVCRTLCHEVEQSQLFVRTGIDVAAPLHLVLNTSTNDLVADRLADRRSWFLTLADSDLS